MKRCTIVIIFLFLFVYSSVPQSIITGTVKDKQGEALIVNIMIMASDSTTIAGFTSTDKDGKYAIRYTGQTDSLQLTASGILIGKHSKIIANRSQTVNFTIEESNLQLKEVIITSSKIKNVGDTISYSVAAYTDQNDRVIGDVLKKLPGIEVTLGGQISYNGKKINRFYIENLDLLQGRYGLATNNISAKDVETVEVMENHQPIKVLQDRAYSEDPAINLKLKESAKGTLALSGAAGLGYEPVMWNAELIAMYFTRQKQNMTTYKSNNSGLDLSREFRSHYNYERIQMSSGSPLSVQSAGNPPIDSKRYLNNTSHAAGFNHLTKLKESLELTTNLSYYNDRQEKESYSYFEQYLPSDSVLAIEQDVVSVSKIHNAEIGVRLNANESDYYLNNALNLRGSWNSDWGNGIIRSNADNLNENISQHLDKPSFAFDNSFSLIKNTKNNTYNTFFSIGYGHRPHVLKVIPAGFIDASYASVTQDVLSKDFATLLRFTFGLKRDNFTMDYGLWGRADVRNLDTELQAEDAEGKSMSLGNEMRNDLGYNNYQGGVNQTYTYDKGQIKTRASLPLTYYVLTINNRLPGNYTNENKLIFNPSLSFTYRINTLFDLSANGSIRKSYGDMNSAYSGYIMYSYQNLLRNTIDKLFETRSDQTGLSLTYRDVFSALFFSVNAGYTHFWRNLLYGYDYRGIMSIKTTIDQPTESELYTIGINGSKGLNFWSATVRANAGYNENHGQLLIQDEILNTRSQNYRVGASIYARPRNILGVNYSFSWNQNRNFTIEQSRNFDPIESISQSTQINIFPSRTITINLKAEHQYNSVLTNRNNFFADMELKLRHNQIDWELEINNLFNTQEYISANYSDISMSYYSYRLRPFSVLLKARFDFGKFQ